MSGGFTPGLRRKDYGIDGQASFLASEHMQVKRAGATFDASAVTADADGNKVIEAGTFVVPVDATGKYVPYVDGGEGAAPDPDTSGFIVESINLRDGDVLEGIILHGSVLEARVTPTPVPAAVKTACAGRITFQ